MFGMLSRLDRMVIRETLRSVGYTLAVVLVLLEVHLTLVLV